jgi:hypothetical protein
MRADPEPFHVISLSQPQRPVGMSDADGPDGFLWRDLLKLETWMIRIVYPQREFRPGTILYIGRKLSITPPKP